MPVDLIVLLGTYLMCWQGYRMRRKVSGLGHIALVASLLGTLANSTTARISGDHTHGALTGQYIDLLEHIFVVISCAGLYVFRLAAEKYTLRSARVWRAIGCAVAVSGAFTALVVLAIHRGRLLSVTAESFRDPVGFAYNFGSGLYYGLTMLLIALWLIRYTRSEGNRHFKRGLRIAAAGLFALSALCLGRAVPVLVVFLGGPPVVAPPFLLGAVTAVSFPLVFLGLSYPLVISRWAAYRAWRHQDGVGTQLAVLWKTCVAAYPEVVLRPGSWLERFRQALWKPYKLRRRRTEIFDGLAKLLITSTGREPGHHERIARDTLRTAVYHYDSTHDRGVGAVIAPEPGEQREGIPVRPDDDVTEDMLLDLARHLQAQLAMTTVA